MTDLTATVSKFTPHTRETRHGTTQRLINSPGFIRLSFLFTVKNDLHLAQALREVDVLTTIESLHRGGHELLRCLGLLKLVEESRHLVATAAARGGREVGRDRA